LNLELAGEYLLMAAELTRIKSKVLLPDPKTDEDGEEGEDPRLALARRLLEYKRFKNAAFELRQKEHDRQQMFSRQGELVFDDEPEEAMVSASVFELFSAFKKVLEQKTFRQDYEVKITTLSVAERFLIRSRMTPVSSVNWPVQRSLLPGRSLEWWPSAERTLFINACCPEVSIGSKDLSSNG